METAMEQLLLKVPEAAGQLGISRALGVLTRHCHLGEDRGVAVAGRELVQTHHAPQIAAATPPADVPAMAIRHPVQEVCRWGLG